MAAFSTKTRRLKFWWNLTVAFLFRYQFRIFIFFVLFWLIFFAILKAWPSISRSNVVAIGYIGNFDIDQIPAEVLYLATQSLITRDVEGKSIPSLATHWTVSGDGKTYVLFLRDNLTWHDGTPLEAKDISVAISGVGITALNNKAIEFKLPNPISSFPQVLNKPIFKTNSFYGIGEYRIVDIDRIENIVKKITLHPKSNNLPRVEIKFYPTADTAQTAFKIGEVKVLDVTNAKDLESWQNLEVSKKIDPYEIVTVFYNTQDRLLGSKELRQALSYAINRTSFDGKAAHGPISIASWAYNPNIKRYDYNTGKAKELLAKTQIDAPSLTLTTTPGLMVVANQIKSDWEALGIKVEIKEEKGIPTDFQALLATNKLPYDPDQYSLWHSTQSQTNITKYASQKIDKLLEDGRTVKDDTERKNLYLDFQKDLVEDTPATFLYNPYKYQIVYKNIKSLYDKLPKNPQ